MIGTSAGACGTGAYPDVKRARVNYHSTDLLDSWVEKFLVGGLGRRGGQAGLQSSPPIIEVVQMLVYDLGKAPGVEVTQRLAQSLPVGDAVRIALPDDLSMQPTSDPDAPPTSRRSPTTRSSSPRTVAEPNAMNRRGAPPPRPAAGIAHHDPRLHVRAASAPTPCSSRWPLAPPPPSAITDRSSTSGVYSGYLPARSSPCRTRRCHPPVRYRMRAGHRPAHQHHEDPAVPRRTSAER